MGKQMKVSKELVDSMMKSMGYERVDKLHPRTKKKCPECGKKGMRRSKYCSPECVKKSFKKEDVKDALKKAEKMVI